LSAECASEKKIENWSIIGEDIDKSKEPRFYGQGCIMIFPAVKQQ